MSFAMIGPPELLVWADERNFHEHRHSFRPALQAFRAHRYHRIIPYVNRLVVKMQIGTFGHNLFRFVDFWREHWRWTMWILVYIYGLSATIPPHFIRMVPKPPNHVFAPWRLFWDTICYDRTTGTICFPSRKNCPQHRHMSLATGGDCSFPINTGKKIDKQMSRMFKVVCVSNK